MTTDLPPLGLGYPRTELRRQLVDAVLAGEKTATAGLWSDYEAEGEPLASAGDRFVLHDFDDEPVAIVRVTEARLIPAAEIDVDFARDEGEGFESVDDWRIAHEAFFEQPILPETQIVALRFAVEERSLMRVWIDMTASAHVLVFRPLIDIMRERGDEVEITAREYAQTLQLLELHGLSAEVIGRHGGRSRVQKARQMTHRLGALKKWAKHRDFDVALAHGSHELTLTARRLGVPSSDTFDYEFATLQHQIGCRAATKVVVPDSIPPERLEPYGVRPPKLVQYPGLKEEYYLSDFEPDRSLLDRFGVDSARVLVVLRPPPDVSLYHRHSNPLFPMTLDHLGRLENVHAFVLPRTEEQREYVRKLDLPSVILPEKAVDAQSLIALADLVVSAGGTMNREAAALGVPVYTTYGGRLGGVDEALDPRRQAEAAHRSARTRPAEARSGGEPGHSPRSRVDARAAPLGPSVEAYAATSASAASSSLP